MGLAVIPAATNPPNIMEPVEQYIITNLASNFTAPLVGKELATYLHSYTKSELPGSTKSEYGTPRSDWSSVESPETRTTTSPQEDMAEEYLTEEDEVDDNMEVDIETEVDPGESDIDDYHEQEGRHPKKEQIEQMSQLRLASPWEKDTDLIESALEGSGILDAATDEILGWCVPIVWAKFVRGAHACKHVHPTSVNSPNPHQLHHSQRFSLSNPPTKLRRRLLESIPHYHDSFTRSIVLTHALFFLHRMQGCFLCDYPIPERIALKNQAEDGKKSSDANERIALLAVERRVALLFGASVWFASTWLVDYVCGENKYWKKYTHNINPKTATSLTRYILRSWGYSINMSREVWLQFVQAALVRYPFPFKRGSGADEADDGGGGTEQQKSAKSDISRRASISGPAPTKIEKEVTTTASVPTQALPNSRRTI